MKEGLKNALREEIKRGSQQVMWNLFDLLLEHHKKMYKNPVEMLESDLRSSFNIWNPTKENCSQCGNPFPDRAGFSPIGYADFRNKKFCSLDCAENWLDEYRSNVKPQML